MSDPNEMQIGGTHYKAITIQWDALKAWLTTEELRGFLRGNIIIYSAMANANGGVEDIKKTRHYADKLIQVMEAGNDK
jgi:hypothetical protein